MEFLICITSIFILIWSKYKYKRLICPCFIFIAFFTICTLVGSLTIHGQNKAKDSTYFLIWISLVVYSISFSLVYKFKKVRNKRNTFENININKKIIYLLAIISIIITITQFSRSFNLLINGMNISEIRGEYWTGTSITTNALDDFIQTTINGGVMLALIIITTIEFFFNEKKDYKLLILVIINVVLRTLTTSGRLLMYDFLITMIFCYFYFRIIKIRKNKWTINFKKIFKLYIPVIICIFLLVYLSKFLTGQRQSDITFLNAVYDDFTCFLPLMDHVIDLLNQNGHITYGISSFDGIIIIINVILSFLGLPQVLEANIINIYDVPFFNIGGGNYANAYVSYIFYFYLDARLIGVILGNIFFGSLSAIIYKNLLYRPGKRELAMYLFLNYIIFRTMIRWQFSTGSVYIELLILTLFYKYGNRIKLKK
ncbi:O-antigen polymerase [Clostridium perfringens]